MVDNFKNKENESENKNSDSLKQHYEGEKNLSNEVVDRQIRVREYEEALVRLEGQEYVDEFKADCKEKGLSEDEYYNRLIIAHARACEREIERQTQTRELY